MRRFLAFALLAALGAFIPGPVQAHEGDHLEHVSPTWGRIDPGEEKAYPLRFENGSFQAGWLFGVFGALVPPPSDSILNVSLVLNGTVLDRWQWSAARENFNTTTLSETAEYDLVLYNPTIVPQRFLFYFDQSCDCLAKPITVSKGIVLFNFPFKAGDRASVEIPSVEGWELKGTVATRADPRGHWPEDFRVWTEATFQGKGWLKLRWKASEDATHYVFVQALQGAQFSLDQTQMKVVEITPLVERDKGFLPGPALGAPLALAAALLLFRPRRA